MLPDEVLSSQVIAAQFRFPRNIPKRPLIDYEYGGAALQDASRGLRDRVWKGEVIGEDVILSAQGVAPETVLTVEGIADFGFTFDQNMNVFVTYRTEAGGCFYYWFDSLVSGYVTTQLPVGSITPRCAIDDNRTLQVSVSDIILAYVRAGTLYFRAQRDRYLVEYNLAGSIGPGGLIQVGMNEALRFQFLLSSASS